MDPAQPIPEQQPRPLVQVDPKFIYVFDSIFKASKGSRCCLKWKEFLKAMSSVGFSHKPAESGGAARLLTPPATITGTTIVLHQPHDGELNAQYQNNIAHMLHTVYGWEKGTFVAGA
ncbi:hypothetical protein L226DRAFT_569858 [Lentinus tigrinus ALCF2SS1-7]|uniref:Uncharacterized protein n=1 Tax=Lentinus tigrinus ALCF2SS1-6 TaxID=1328759 RepID=A0A5C2SL94_9APHY|nr:hypothetical protein L227DRAFT_608082 [Lentinus tigrinus ALCF2SS1-6]RPD76621.1 hypothetical protein L226DRAFT_569858 [Lentinus tigrinus ALCF2SS1-7]